MSTPIATSDDLALYLGAEVDEDRATFVLLLAQNLCETIINPLPASANAVVLEVASRAFTNPTRRRETKLGNAEIQFASAGLGDTPGGLYLSRADKANLRRLAGSGGAFSIDVLPKGVAAVQSITLSGATGGTFALSFVGQIASALGVNASAAQIQAALAGLTVIGGGNVSVAGADGGPFTVTFAGTLATTPVPVIGVDTTLLTGTSPAAAVTVVRQGVLAPGQGLPPWDYDYYRGRTQYLPGGFV